MLSFKLIVFAIAISSGALDRATGRGNIRHKQPPEEYKYNHPPAPENYEAVPVAVVYEDQGSREDKSIKNDVTSRNNVEEVSKETPKSEPAITKQPTEETNDERIDTKPTTVKQAEPKPTTYRPQKETYQIPVAVIYEPETINNQKPSRNNNRGANNSRTIQQPALEEKQTMDEDNYSSRAQVNGHIGTDASAYKRPELNRRQKIPKPTTEKQTFVGDNTSQVSQASPTSDKPEELYIRQRPQKPATKETQTTVESNTPSLPTEKQPENLVSTENSKRPISEQKQTKFDNNTSISDQKYRNPPSAPKPERSETIKVTENTQQYTKRGNSTRVREVIPIIQSENVVFSHSGNFKYSYEGGDGTKAFEEGELKMFDDETAGEAVSGGFSYTAKDGNEYSLSYTADENGYRPVGAHLPTPPPIPPAIARALAYLATKTTPAPVTESIVKSDQ